MKNLADGRFGGPFTRTGADAVGATEELEEVMRDLAVPELDGSEAGRCALEFFGDTGRVGVCIQLLLGVEPLHQDS